VGNPTLETLGTKMTRGTMTEGRTVLITQHHTVREIEATHQTLHEEVEVILLLMMGVDMRHPMPRHDHTTTLLPVQTGCEGIK
jgi:hypothetical protein